MSITAKELIKLLQKCDPSAIVFVPDSELLFVEFCPVSNEIHLCEKKPSLNDIYDGFSSMKILEQEECFAKTVYYDMLGDAC